MSTLFPLSPAQSAGAGAGADVSQYSAPQRSEQSPSLGLGNNTDLANMSQFHSHGPSLPPHLGGDHSLSTPPSDHLPQRSDDRPHLSGENSSAPMKPESRSNRGPPKHATPAPSPNGHQNSSGRRRARTKVVAWDRNDLEDIYHKKEVLKHDWDSICQKPGKSSNHSDSPQPMTNGIKWASVNGYQSSHADGEESNDEDELSSAPDSEMDGKPNDQFEPPSRSMPLQTRAQSTTDVPSYQPIIPSTPVNIQEASHINGQGQTNFDLIAAQSRGKQIAPRQPPFSSTSLGASDEGQPPPPDRRPTPKNKRGRETEESNIDSRSSSTFAKRRKQQSEPARNPMMPGSVGEGYATPFNTPMAPFNQPPMASQPPPPLRMPQDAELDDIFMQLRERDRVTKAFLEDDFKGAKAAHEAAVGRANVRAREAELKLDDMSQQFAERAKEKDILHQIELESKDKQIVAEKAQNQTLREELAKCREQLAAANAENHHAAIQGLNNVNKASTEAAKALLLERKKLSAQFQDIKKQHDQGTVTIEEFVAKDLEDMTYPDISKYIANIKDGHHTVANSIKDFDQTLNESKPLVVESTQQSATAITNGSVPDGHT
ncbi:MAG: hypothetical protein Q9218_002221 [Villophora microphyllina]